MSEPLFKVGDTVRIKARKGYAFDYRFSYTNHMARYAGESAIITDMERAKGINVYKEPDDGFRYKLTIDGGNFGWASSMLEPIIIIPNVINTDTTSGSTERINIKLKPVEKIKFNFKN